MKKLEIKYNPKGSGSEYGIRVHGNLEYLLKFIFYLTSKGHQFPLDSHHGTFFYLEDHGISLRIAMHGWTHDNKGNGTAKPILIFENSAWETSINEHGYEGRQQKPILKSTKDGLKKLVTRLGHEIASSWNDDGDYSTVSICLMTEIEFDAKETDQKIIEFVGRLREMCEITSLV